MAHGCAYGILVAEQPVLGSFSIRIQFQIRYLGPHLTYFATASVTYKDELSRKLNQLFLGNRKLCKNVSS